MSIILQPQRDFPIVRQIANHLDENTYYVRAVVRDANGSLIENVDLTDQGGQRFQKAWRVPADPSGQGRYISIVTSVYTDSGYTTKSNNYGDEETTYLVFDRVMPAMRGGGGGASATDVRRIIEDALSKQEKPEAIDYDRMPKAREYEMRWDELLLALEVVRQGVAKLPQQATDLSGINTALAELRQAIAEKEVTPETDLQPVLNAIESLNDSREMNHRETSDRIEDKQASLLEQLPLMLSEAIATTKFVSQFHTAAVPESVAPKRQDEQPLDLSKLSL